MRDLVGYKLDTLPFDGLQRISNVIEFEGPLLSHYRDSFNKNYLFYWVEADENHNRWLVWEIDIDSFYLYLAQEISLRNLFPNSSDNIFIVDINAKAVYERVLMTYAATTPEEYFPEIDSFFHFDIPEIYEDEVKNVEYFKRLKEKALYVDLKSRSGRHARTIGIPDVKQAIDQLTKSLAAFISYGVKNDLSAKYPANRNYVKRIAANLSNLSRFRVVYLNLNSFHIGIAADSLATTDQGVDDSIAAYQHQALKLYQEQILDNDFTDQNDIDILVKSIPDEEARKEIFEPLIKIMNNDNIEFHVSDYTKGFERTYEAVPKEEVAVLIPPTKKIFEEKPEIEHELLVAYYIADKVGDQISMFPRDKSQFITIKKAKSFPIEIDDFVTPNGEMKKFLTPIEIEVEFEDDLLILNYEPLGLFITSDSDKKIKLIASAEIGKLYSNYITDADLTFEAFFKSRPLQP
jgi:hypothetical protein